MDGKTREKLKGKLETAREPYELLMVLELDRIATALEKLAEGVTISLVNVPLQTAAADLSAPDSLGAERLPDEPPRY